MSDLSEADIKLCHTTQESMSCVTRLSYNHKGDQSKSPWTKRVNSLVEEY